MFPIPKCLSIANFPFTFLPKSSFKINLKPKSGIFPVTPFESNGVFPTFIEAVTSRENKKNVDVKKTKIAARAHDMVKEIGTENMNTLIKKFKINDSYLGNDNLSHGKVAAKILEKQVMLNREIVDAVSFHTTAREGMSLMEKIVFLADAIEENRTYDGVDEIRDLAFENIDAACLKVLENTVQHLADKGIKKIDRDSIKAICWFKEILNKRRGDKA